MSDYKRFVSYLYEYIAEKKTNNRGFVKVELRSGTCRLQFQLKVFSLPEQTPITVYGYIYRDGRLTGYPLGLLRSGKNGIGGLITVSARIAGTAYNVLDFNGLILTEPSGKFYASQWDDNPVNPNLFQTVPDSNKEEHQRSSAGNSPAKTSEYAENLVQETSESAQNIVQETFESTDGMSPELTEVEILTQTDSTALEEELHASSEFRENPITETAETSVITDTTEIADASVIIDTAKIADASVMVDTAETTDASVTADTTEIVDASVTLEDSEPETIPPTDEFPADESTNGVPEQELVTPPAPSIPPVRSGFDHPEEAPPSGAPTENQPPPRQPTPPDIPLDPGDLPNWRSKEVHTRRRQSVQPKKWDDRNQHSGISQQSMGSVVQEPRTQISAWASIRQQYPSIQPFDDDEFGECVRVTIRDFSDLRRRGLPVGCNQFIHHGFQNYRHLLIGHTSGCYILGVPGVYNSNEQYLASMYGFSHFKPGRLKEGPYNGRSGYWYRSIKP